MLKQAPATEKDARGGPRKGAGRKPGEPRMAVEMPVRLVELARAERARRLHLTGERAGVPTILAEWATEGQARQALPSLGSLAREAAEREGKAE